MAEPYAESVDLKQVFSSEEREALKRHRVTPGVAPWAFVALTILTFGLFGTIYHQLKQSKLPVVKHNDPTAAKAIGFLLIPVFNLYWSFVAWPRLVDRSTSSIGCGASGTDQSCARGPSAGSRAFRMDRPDRGCRRVRVAARVGGQPSVGREPAGHGPGVTARGHVSMVAHRSF